jgi:hypothetical protein
MEALLLSSGDQQLLDRGKHSMGVVDDLLVGKSQHGECVEDEDVVTPPIVGVLARGAMIGPINLDDTSLVFPHQVDADRRSKWVAAVKRVPHAPDCPLARG